MSVVDLRQDKYTINTTLEKEELELRKMELQLKEKKLALEGEEDEIEAG